jgi:hypothetical protein
MRLLKFVGALALALNLAVSAIAAPICEPEPSHKVYARTTADPGGFIEDYSKFVARTRRHLLRPIRVEIRGECDSACVMKLSARNVCVSRNRSSAFTRSARSTNMCAGYSGSKRDEPGTAEYRAQHAGLRAAPLRQPQRLRQQQITKFTGQEVLDACPQIKACK